MESKGDGKCFFFLYVCVIYECVLKENSLPSSLFSLQTYYCIVSLPFPLSDDIDYLFRLLYMLIYTIKTLVYMYMELVFFLLHIQLRINFFRRIRLRFPRNGFMGSSRNIKGSWDNSFMSRPMSSENTELLNCTYSARRLGYQDQ